MTDITPERLQNFYRYLKPLKCSLKVHSDECRYHRLALTLEAADLWEWCDLLIASVDRDREGFSLHSMYYFPGQVGISDSRTGDVVERDSVSAMRTAVIAALEKWEQERE